MKDAYDSIKGKILLPAILLLSLLILSGWLFTGYLVDIAKRAVKTNVDDANMIISLHLINELKRIENAAAAVAGSPLTPPIFQNKTPENVEKANNILDRYNKSLGGAVCYLIDKRGLTLTSSNRKDRDSFVGQNYTFRPYFQDAVKGGSGRYFAYGTVSKRRGFYAAAPVRNKEGDIVGVVAIKKELDEIEEKLNQHIWFLAERNGIIFLSSKPEARLKSIWPLQEQTRQKIIDSKQFGPGPFDPVLPREPQAGVEVEFQGERYLTARQATPYEGVFVMLLWPTKQISIYRSLGIAVALFINLLALSILFVTVWNRRLRRVVTERAKVQRELKSYAEDLESRSAAKSRIAGISADLQQAESFNGLAQTFMSQCIPLLGVQYGVLYVLDQDQNLLIPAACYGFTGDEAQRSFAIGQGLIGQCALEMKPITIRDTTDSGIFINWGMGETTPREILLLPLLQRGRAVGVLQLASVSAFHENGLAYLEELVSMLAMNIEILDRNLHTRSLLEATQEQSAKLQSQQKELLVSSMRADAANQSLQQQVAELARARRTMMNIMEDLEMSRKETEERNRQTQELLEQTQRQAEELNTQKEQIKDTEMWFRGIIESAPDGMLVIDEQGDIILVNRILEDMFGYGTGELLGKKIETLVPESVRARHVELRDHFMQKGLIRQFGRGLDLRGARRDGSEFPVEIGLALLPAMGTRGRSVCASVRDITERKQIEEERRQHMEELERFEKLTVGREEKMITLKQEINDMLVRMGSEAKYKIVE
jgi:PAS domain S-box-containing protein